MIMGDGKTTVVGPLLALMLAGAQSATQGGMLVTLVCPKALLAQSKGIMRAIFSAPLMPKPVYTLDFDRGFDSRASSLRQLRDKLVTASNELGIVVASPTALKSYFLKYIELLLMKKAKLEGGLHVAPRRIREQKPGAGKSAGLSFPKVMPRRKPTTGIGCLPPMWPCQHHFGR
jgi:hypothetical protein